jgi:hypothetical protein
MLMKARVPSASACHDTMQTVSKAILDQLANTKPPAEHASPSRVCRGAPISSSRDDPLPNEAFPAPLPQITLPYEFSLLDNLFLNPMSSHNKASDYTNGNKRSKLASELNATGATVPGSFGGAPPQGFPPGAFHTANFGSTPTTNTNIAAMNGLGAYGMATQVPGMNTAQNFVEEGARPLSSGGPGTEVNADGSFDIFNFLMDEEGGLGGTGNWDALEVPADFSLWS